MSAASCRYGVTDNSIANFGWAGRSSRFISLKVLSNMFVLLLCILVDFLLPLLLLNTICCYHGISELLLSPLVNLVSCFYLCHSTYVLFRCLLYSLIVNFILFVTVFKVNYILC